MATVGGDYATVFDLMDGMVGTRVLVGGDWVGAEAGAAIIGAGVDRVVTGDNPAMGVWTVGLEANARAGGTIGTGITEAIGTGATLVGSVVPTTNFAGLYDFLHTTLFSCGR